MKQKINKNISTIYTLFNEPSLYFKYLLINTFVFADFIFLINVFFVYLFPEVHDIPLNIHGYVSFVIGLLLIFRTNTGYGRWWEARQILDSIYSSLYILNKKHCFNKLELFEYLFDLKKYLKNEYDNSHKNIIKFHDKVLSNNEIKEVSNELIKSFSSLVRIKETPIPMAYSVHIKISIFIYLSSLSLVLTTNIGLYSVPTIAIIYYIISGVENISKEIENPFEGTPNDLQLDEIFNSWKKDFK